MWNSANWMILTVDVTKHMWNGCAWIGADGGTAYLFVASWMGLSGSHSRSLILARKLCKAVCDRRGGVHFPALRRLRILPPTPLRLIRERTLPARVQRIQVNKLATHKQSLFFFFWSGCINVYIKLTSVALFGCFGNLRTVTHAANGCAHSKQRETKTTTPRAAPSLYLSFSRRIQCAIVSAAKALIIYVLVK